MSAFDPRSLAQTARLYLHTIREIVADADGPNSFAAECAATTLDSLDVLQAALEIRRTAIRAEIAQAQETEKVNI